MSCTPASRKAIRILVSSLLLAGCATPVGIRIADPREVQRYLTRSALTDDVPSDFSLNELRRYDLLDTWEGDPDGVLATLHGAALANGLPSDALFALAELSFLRAEDTELQVSYGAAMVYAYAFLFPGDGRPPLDSLDPRQRVAADLYNRALTLAFKRTAKGTLALDPAGEFQLPFARLTVERPPTCWCSTSTSSSICSPWPSSRCGAAIATGRRARRASRRRLRPLPTTVPVVEIGPGCAYR
jgi:hypothetical protein